MLDNRRHLGLMADLASEQKEAGAKNIYWRGSHEMTKMWIMYEKGKCKEKEKIRQ